VTDRKPPPDDAAAPELDPPALPGRRKVFIDLSPLRESRDFRLLSAGQAVSWMGGQATVVAVAYQVYVLTGSSMAVGLVGLANLGPLIAMSLFGGAIADAVDRRRLLLVTQVLLALMSVGLALNASSGAPALWPIYLLSALTAGLSGVDLPTRNAMIPRLVGRQAIPAASALGQIIMQMGLILGPALAGLIIARVSLASAYWLDVATFVVSIATVSAIRSQPPEGGGTRAGLSSVREGIRYLRGRRLLVSTFVIDIDAMVFGMPRALFPALGLSLYGGGAATVGLLYAAPGLGAFVGALLTGWVVSVRRQGRVRARPVATRGARAAGRGRSGRRGLRRVPQHHPAGERPRRPPGSSVGRAHRRRHRRALPRRRRSRRGGGADLRPRLGGDRRRGLHARRRAPAPAGPRAVGLRRRGSRADTAASLTGNPHPPDPGGAIGRPVYSPKARVGRPGPRRPWVLTGLLEGCDAWLTERRFARLPIS